MAENGRLPASDLSPIPGGRLRHDAAAAWNAMRAEIGAKTGIWIRPTGRMSSYRTYDQQVYLWNLYKSGQGNLAAYPGTSSHGFGITVDAPSPEMWKAINQYGAKYGFQKRWSDAPTEPWHFRYRTGIWDGRSHDEVIIRKGSTARTSIERLQKLLRAVGYKSVKVDGHYGIVTRIAVRRFQRKHKLTVDGVVGASTWKTLRKAAG